MALSNREKWMAQMVADYYGVTELEVNVSNHLL